MEMKYGSVPIKSVKYCNSQGTLQDVNSIWRNGAMVWPPLTFTAQTAGSTLYLLKSSASAPTVTLEYSVDGGATWTTFVTSATESECTHVTLANVGDKVMLRAGPGGNTTFGAFVSPAAMYHKFVMTGSIAASGNIQSLLDADLSKTDVGDYCYYGMFNGCTSLTAAPALPATTLAGHCYDTMFQDCSSLVSAPALPATTLADSCYYGMFQDCSSLVSAPALPATRMASQCYRTMFYGCSSLVFAPKIYAEALASFCFQETFFMCEALHVMEVTRTPLSEDYLLHVPSGTEECYRWNRYTFGGTGGTFIGSPSIGYYYFATNS